MGNGARGPRRAAARVLAVLATVTAALGARTAAAADPTTIHAGVSSNPIDVAVTPGEWGADPTPGLFHGKGKVVVRLGETPTTLDAHWTGLAVDETTGKVTAGTIAVDVPPAGLDAALGLDLHVSSLEIRPAAARVLAGALSVPAATKSSWGWTLAPIDLAGTDLLGAPGGEIAGGCVLADATVAGFDLLGLTLVPAAKLQVDLSSTTNLPTTAVPDSVTGGAAAWTGIYLASASVKPSVGGTGGGAPLSGLAVSLDFAAGTAHAKATVSPTSTAPFSFTLSGIETSVAAGSISLDSEGTARLSGSATGTMSQGGGTPLPITADFGASGIDVAIKPFVPGDPTTWLATTTALPVRIGSLHVAGADAATGTLSKADLSVPTSVLGVGLSMPPLLDLSGTPIVASSMSLAYLEIPISGPIGLPGLALGPKATLRADLSDTENAPAAKIPPAHIGGAGVTWRGLYLTDTNVAIGSGDPATGAPLEFFSVGWPSGPVSGAPEFRGSVKPRATNPLGGSVSGVGLRLTTGTLTFDSAGPTKIAGTFDGKILLPGSDDGAWGDVGGLSVAYGPGEGFQFVVDHVKPATPLGFGIGEFGAHASDFGVDASAKAEFSSPPTGTGAPEWTGLVVHEGDLSLPLAVLGDGNALPLAISEFVLPFKSPGKFSAWLELKSEKPVSLLSAGGASLKVVATRPTGVAAVPGDSPAPGKEDLTAFHIVDGSLSFGRLFGLLSIPGVSSPVGIGAQVDKDGGFLAEFTIAELALGEFKFTDVAAVLDLSRTASPKVTGVAEPAAEWTGLMLKSLTATLPWPFEKDGGGGASFTAKGWMLDQGLTGRLTLTTTEALGVKVKGSGKFDARLKTFDLKFVHGDLDSLSSTGTMNAKPFVVDPLAFTLDYDAAKGFVLRADIPKGDQAFGFGDVVKFGFTVLAIEVPSASSGKKPALRMDGAVSVKVDGITSPAFKFEGVRLRSDGTLNPGGGWIDLREYGHLDFHAFGVDVREIGFGSVPDGEHWFGLSGGIRVSEALGMDVSVQANKLRWFEGGGFTVDEVALQASVQGVVSIDGKVKYQESGAEKEFRGSVSVGVSMAGGTFKADIAFVAGHGSSGFEYWGVAGSFTLPAPVVLGTTGFALFGVKGGCAYHLKPTGPYVYDWPADPGASLSFQAGVTVGTATDVGFTFNAGVTLTMTLSPLVLRLDGLGHLLTAMDASDDDRVVQATVVFDSSGPSFDASLTLGKSASQPFQVKRLVQLRGIAALHVGKDGAFFHIGTKAQPISATVFPDFGGITASAWFAIDWPGYSGLSITTGAYAGWGFSYDLGVCDVSGHLESGGEVAVHFGPFSFSGSLSASIGVSACGIGFDLGASCGVSGLPVHVAAHCSLEIDLPWPLPDPSLSFDVSLP